MRPYTWLNEIVKNQRDFGKMFISLLVQIPTQKRDFRPLQN
jgi:hypothetical protein